MPVGLRSGTNDVPAVADSVTAVLTVSLRKRGPGLLRRDVGRVPVRGLPLAGRDRTIDVVSSGHGVLPLDALKSLFERDIARLSRRYDAVVLVSAPDQVSMGLPTALPIPDVVFCARTGQTPVAELKKTLEEIQQAGCRVRGVVLWDAPDPALLEQESSAPQPARREPAAVG